MSESPEQVDDYLADFELLKDAYMDTKTFTALVNVFLLLSDEDKQREDMSNIFFNAFDFLFGRIQEHIKFAFQNMDFGLSYPDSIESAKEFLEISAWALEILKDEPWIGKRSESHANMEDFVKKRTEVPETNMLDERLGEFRAYFEPDCWPNPPDPLDFYFQEMSGLLGQLGPLIHWFNRLSENQSEAAQALLPKYRKRVEAFTNWYLGEMEMPDVTEMSRLWYKLHPRERDPKRERIDALVEKYRRKAMEEVDVEAKIEAIVLNVEKRNMQKKLAILIGKMGKLERMAKLKRVLEREDEFYAGLWSDDGSFENVVIEGWNLKADYTERELKKEFQRRALEVHPDHKPEEEKEVWAKEFRDLCDEYELLMEICKTIDTGGMRLVMS
ncbi:J domain-containing protein [Candidatus Gracilibacteria bacterium]|nr:J domain-containing protein [Candidatus Gracilibacteria bacterium]